jgi:hypothetical protein
MAMGVAIAMVIGLFAVGWSTLASTTHRLQPVLPPTRIIPPPGDMVVHQTAAALEARVLAQIANDSSRAGVSLAEPRIISATYLPAGNAVSGVGTSGAPAWAVEFQGTYLECFGSCTVQSRYVLVFDDRTGDRIYPASSFLLSHGGGFPVVCEAYQLEGQTFRNHRNALPAALPPCLPTTSATQP